MILLPFADPESVRARVCMRVSVCVCVCGGGGGGRVVQIQSLDNVVFLVIDFILFYRGKRGSVQVFQRKPIPSSEMARH